MPSRVANQTSAEAAANGNELARQLKMARDDGKSLSDIDVNGLSKVEKLVQKKVLRCKHNLASVAIGWSANSKSFVAGYQGGTMVLWDAANALVSQFYCAPGTFPTSVSISPQTDKSLVAIGGLDNAVSIVDMSPTIDVCDISTTLGLNGDGHEGFIAAMHFLDPATLVSASGDGDALVWDVEGGTRKQALKGHTKDVLCLVPVPLDDAQPGSPSRLLATGSLDQTVRLWDVREARGSAHTFQCDAEVLAIDVFPNGGYTIASGCSDGVVRIFDVRAQTTVAELKAPDEMPPITGLQFSATGRAIYTSHATAVLAVWDPYGPRAGRVHKTKVIRQDAKTDLVSLRRSPDGECIAAACQDGSVRTFGTGKGK